MYIWNVTVLESDNKGFISGFQFETKDIRTAIKMGEVFGTVIKVALSNYDDE